MCTSLPATIYQPCAKNHAIIYSEAADMGWSFRFSVSLICLAIIGKMTFLVHVDYLVFSANRYYTHENKLRCNFCSILPMGRIVQIVVVAFLTPDFMFE